VVASIAPASIRKGVERILKAAKVDAVFVSCTSVRLAESAAAIEKETGVPITSSNHAMAWHSLRLAGVNDALPQFGSLFALPLKD
jgi:maleate isomerase